MIGITGANGHLGMATIKFLLNTTLPGNIVAIVRDPEKMKPLVAQGIVVRKADYNDYNSLVTAFKGLKKLLQISTTSIEEEGVSQEENVVHTATEAHIDQIIYTSSVAPKNDAHFLATHQSIKTEKTIIASGVSYAILEIVFTWSLYQT